MRGRAGYSERLAHLSRADREAAIAALPDAVSRLLRRTEIDRCPHKIVAAELGLSMRQFYRRRALAIALVSGTPKGNRTAGTADDETLPVGDRMIVLTIANAIEQGDVARLRAVLSRQSGAAAGKRQAAPGLAVMLIVAEAAVARIGGDVRTSRAKLSDVARLVRDMSLRSRVAPSTTYGLSAMLKLATDLLEQGRTDEAIALTADVGAIAADLRDPQLEIQTDAIAARALLALPGHIDVAHARAVCCVRRCSAAMTTRTIVVALQTLTSSLAELGRNADALLLRDVVAPLAAVSPAADERAEFAVWSAGVEAQCGSAARAADLAHAARQSALRGDHVWTGATMVRAHALTALGSHAAALRLAQEAAAASRANTWARLAGDAELTAARNHAMLGDPVAARTRVAAAIALLDRSSPVSVQRRAYAFSYELTRNSLHGMLADALRPD